MDQTLNDVRHKLITGIVTPEEAARQLEAAAAAIRNQANNPDSVTVQHVWKPVLLIGLLAGAALFWVYTTIRRLREKTGAQVSTGSRVRMRWQYVALFLGPAALLYTLFVVIPSVKSFAWSVNRWNGLSADMSFVGLLHFKRLLLESDAFWIALKNNLFIMFVIPMFVLPLALFLAVCISRGVRGSQAFRIVFFFPNLLGGVAATLLWMHLYNPQGGLVNGVLTGLGLSGFESFAWLAQNNLYWALVPMAVWGGVASTWCSFSPPWRVYRRASTRPPASTAPRSGASSGPSPCP